MKEDFKENINPFMPNGIIGRKNFLITTFILFLLHMTFLFILCPQAIKTFSNPEFINGKSTIEILMQNVPQNEFILYSLLSFAALILSTILNKKRALDIIGNGEKAVLSSYLIAGALFCLYLRSSFFTVTGSLDELICSISGAIIAIFFLFKKGKISGKQSEQNELQDKD